METCFQNFWYGRVIDSIRVTLVMSFWSFNLDSSMLGIFLGLVLEQTKFPGKSW